MAIKVHYKNTVSLQKYKILILGLNNFLQNI